MLVEFQRFVAEWAIADSGGSNALMFAIEIDGFVVTAPRLAPPSAEMVSKRVGGVAAEAPLRFRLSEGEAGRGVRDSVGRSA